EGKNTIDSVSRFLSIPFLMLTLLGILCFGTLFLESKTFLNYAVTPKWYLAVFTIAILIVVCCIKGICYATTTIVYYKIVEISLWLILLASGILAIQGILQFFGILTAKDRKSTRLNSSHVKISYAVFCLK